MSWFAMDSNWKARIEEIESRAKSVHLSIGGLCNTAGVKHGNVHRWLRDSRFVPSLRCLQRDLPKLEQALAIAEFEMAARLIRRICPASAPYILTLLHDHSIADPRGPQADRGDSRKDGIAGTSALGDRSLIDGRPDQAALGEMLPAAMSRAAGSDEARNERKAMIA
jgi:hypothetical protein